MSGRVWMSSLKSNSQLGDKQGLRTKFFGEEWEPASFIIPVMSDVMSANMKRSARGYALRREELPEAAAIWNEKSFKKVGEIFWAGGFLVVRGKLAATLSRFDLGEGGLIPFLIYKADLGTPYPDEFFLINFGARKNTLLPQQCEDARRFTIEKTTGNQLWKINYLKIDAEVSMSSAALNGPDLWFEEASHNKIFMSDALGIAIADTRDAQEWRLHECKVVEAQS